MLFENFAKETKLWWNRYLNSIYEQQQKGKLDLQDRIILYPNILLVTDTKRLFVAELIGACKAFTPLKLLQHKEPSIHRYLSQFDASEPDPLFHLNSSDNIIKFMCIAQDFDINVVKDRFPFIELFPSRLKRVGGKGSVLSFGPDFSSCSVENSVIVNSRDNLFRCKNILELVIVKRSISRPELFKHLEYKTDGWVKGVHITCSDREQSLIIGGHFQSMYLFPGLRETTIGDFINAHPNIIKKAFNTSHFLYEPYLEWVEHDGTVTDHAINPDLIVRREDGVYDIYDLKTALLDKTTIVKGPRRRRRFIDYVEEGAAQLANYREYFRYSKNQQLAKDKYGIEVHNPKLILITGNWDNANLEEIDEACRRYNEISILDFDTLAHLFIEKALSNSWNGL